MALIRIVPARELLFAYLKERELGEFITWKEMSNAMEVDDASKSHRNSVNWAKERLAEFYGKTLGPPTPGGFFMVPVSMQQVRVLGPGECAECTMSGVPKRDSCSHKE